MVISSATDFRKNLFSLLDQTISYNEPICIQTKRGNTVLLSEADYLDLLATLEINSNAYLKNKIEEGLKTPIEECISADEVVW